MKRIPFILVFFSLIVLCSCNKISEEELRGDWLVARITYKNRDVIPNSKTVKISLNPVGFESIGEIRFLSSNKSDFPGVETEDLPVIWKIIRDSLFITADSTAIEEHALEEISTLRLQSTLSSNLKLEKLYNLKRDSLLSLRGITNYSIPMQIYLGTYMIKDTNTGLLLISSNTEIELINMDKAFGYVIDRVMR